MALQPFRSCMVGEMPFFSLVIRRRHGLTEIERWDDNRETRCSSRRKPVHPHCVASGLEYSFANEKEFVGMTTPTRS